MDRKCLKYVETKWAIGVGDVLISYWLETLCEMWPAGLHLYLDILPSESATL